MTKSEKEWARKNGLKKTNLVTFVRGKARIVYEAKDGKLYYVDRNVYHGTFKEYCVKF